MTTQTCFTPIFHSAISKLTFNHILISFSFRNSKFAQERLTGATFSVSFSKVYDVIIMNKIDDFSHYFWRQLRKSIKCKSVDRYDFARQLIVWQKNVIVWQNFANVWQNFVNVWQNLANVWQNFVNDWQNFANHRLQIFARQLNIHMLCQTFATFCQTKVSLILSDQFWQINNQKY